MPLPSATPAELISTLKHSSLPTLVVEGKDDVLIYRWLADNSINKEISILQCYGRKNLLQVYEAREQFNHIPTVFLADLDRWTFTDIPRKYEGIVFTSGYSIENDIYSGSSEALERLMESDMTIEFKHKLEQVAKWYAFEIENFLEGNEFSVKHAIERILEKPHFNNLCSMFLEFRSYREPEEETIDFVKEKNYLNLRGKLVTDLLVKVVLKSKEYKSHQIFEVLLKFGEDNPYINDTLDKINQKLTYESTS